MSWDTEETLFFICTVKINNKYYGTKPDKWKHYFVKWLVVQGRDVQTLVAEYLFINIDDQLKALNKRDENELKNLITTPRVKYRRPYDTYIGSILT